MPSTYGEDGGTGVGVGVAAGVGLGVGWSGGVGVGCTVGAGVPGGPFGLAWATDGDARTKTATDNARKAERSRCTATCSRQSRTASTVPKVRSCEPAIRRRAQLEAERSQTLRQGREAEDPTEAPTRHAGGHSPHEDGTSRVTRTDLDIRCGHDAWEVIAVGDWVVEVLADLRHRAGAVHI